MINNDKKNKKDNSVIPIGSTDLNIVKHSISITNKILYGGISELFNNAFCKLNSKQKLRTDIDYLFLLETNPSERKKAKYLYIANKDDDYTKALEMFNSVLKIKPNHLLSIDMGAICKMRLGNCTEAIKDYTKAIEIDPKYAFAYYGRGGAKYYDLKDYKGAIEDYTKAIKIDPEFADAYYNRGNAKSKLKDYKGAIEDYSKAIEIDPEFVDAYYNGGNVKSDLKDYEGAIEDYTKAIEIDPEFVFAYYNRGNAKVDLQDYEGAIEDYSKAFEIDYAAAYYGREHAVNCGDALEAFLKEIEINIEYNKAYNNREYAKKCIGDIEGAK